MSRDVGQIKKIVRVGELTNSDFGTLLTASSARGSSSTTANANANGNTSFGAPSVIRVWLIDRCPSLLEGLPLLLSRQAPDLNVVGSSPQIDHAMAHIAPGQVDVIVCDVEDQHDAAVLAKLESLIRATQGRALVFASGGDSLFYKQLVFAGARGAVNKHESQTTLIKAIRKVHEGEIWLDRHITGSVFDALVHHHEPRHRDSRLERLTARERHLLVQLDKLPGASNKELARHLNLSENTVRNHLSSIYLKVGVSSRLELYAYCQHAEDTMRTGTASNGSRNEAHRA